MSANNQDQPQQVKVTRKPPTDDPAQQGRHAQVHVHINSSADSGCGGGCTGMILRWLVFAILISFVAWVLPGVHVRNFASALLAAAVIALLNASLRAILVLILLPVVILTLGLILFVLNAMMLMIASWLLSPDFQVDSFWSALLGSLLITGCNMAISSVGSGLANRNKHT